MACPRAARRRLLPTLPAGHRARAPCPRRTPPDRVREKGAGHGLPHGRPPRPMGGPGQCPSQEARDGARGQGAPRPDRRPERGVRCGSDSSTPSPCMSVSGFVLREKKKSPFSRFQLFFCVFCFLLFLLFFKRFFFFFKRRSRLTAASLGESSERRRPRQAEGGGRDPVALPRAGGRRACPRGAGGQHHGPWGSQSPGSPTKEARGAGGGGARPPDRPTSAERTGRRPEGVLGGRRPAPHTVDTSVPLPLLTARAP